MNVKVLNKHQQNSAKTRDKLIEAAEHLYGSRSIDAVSLREITAAAGQKNPNALQYHFQNRDGLLQAIIDKHSSRVGILRDAYIERAEYGEWPAAQAAARCLVMPIVDYIDSTPEAVNFVKIVSQITADNRISSENPRANGISFSKSTRLGPLFEKAMSELPPREFQRRIFLAVNITFHSIADICRAGDGGSASKTLTAKGPMFEQLVCVVESFFAAGSRSASS